MKKFLFISIFGLLLAVTASAERVFYPPDVGVEQSIAFDVPVTHFPAMELNVCEVNFSQLAVVVFMPAEKTELNYTFKMDAWRNPDWGGSLSAVCSYNQINLKNSVCGNIRASLNYNVDYSYGLRN